jgi:hypothetical protein
MAYPKMRIELKIATSGAAEGMALMAYLLRFFIIPI